MTESENKYERLALIPGNCLFPDHGGLALDDGTLFFMAEDHGLCSKFKYHKHKLVFVISAMRSHRDELARKYDVEYSELRHENSVSTYEDILLDSCKRHSITEIVTYEMENRGFRNRIVRFCRDNGIKLIIADSPGFLTTPSDFDNYRKEYDCLFMNDFYIWQRKRLGILTTKDGGPAEGKWSFDAENRKKIPEGLFIPEFPEAEKTKHTKDVSKLIDKLFPYNPGSTDNFYLPTTREKALEWMERFFTERFSGFGPYEDAISEGKGLLFHSLLSPLMNAGLLTPSEVIDKALEFAGDSEVPFQSLEGFIRQIIGWREFMRGVYNTEELRLNFFGHERRLNDKWYDGRTGLAPLDSVIKRVVANGYAHHIERLMVMSNIMLLTEIHPGDVYKWFMEMFVDSAEWVMAPNVYGMGQFADGGSFATKPYISGSNYILKMSDFGRGDWCDVWDGLYWRFIDKQKKFFESNPRMSMMVGMLDRMDEGRKKRIIKLAEGFIAGVSS